MNVFEYIGNYINQSTTGQYGDLLNNNQNGKLEQLLESKDREIYNQIKQQDRFRMLQENSNLSFVGQRQINSGSYTTVPGIGMVQQMC